MSSLSNTQINTRSMNGLVNVQANSGTFDDIECNTINIAVQGNSPTPPLLDNSTKIATTAFVLSHSSGNFVDLTTNQTIVSGVKVFNTLPQSSAVPTLGDQLVNKSFTDATYVDFVNNQTIVSGVKTFNTLPQSSVVPTLGDDLVNKTYVDGAISGGSFMTTNTTQTVIGAKTFTTNTLTATAGITVKNGGSAQTCTLTQNATTFDVIGAGDVSIKPTNDFNVLTGTGKNITISNPDSASLSSETVLSTGILNTSSYIDLQSPTVYITGLNTQPSLILSGGFGTIYGLKFSRGGTALTAINRINSSNTNDTLYIEINSGQNITLTDTAISFDIYSTFNLTPTGTIIMHPSSTAPAGYLLCNGTSVATVGIYAKLFAVIGYTYGGAGATFNKPNFQGCFLRGAGSQTVSGTTYTASAIGTIQQDAVLNPLYASNEGFRSCASGARDCVSRDIITADPTDTNTGILPRFDRTATENRPVNHAVYYYIRY